MPPPPAAQGIGKTEWRNASRCGKKNAIMQAVGPDESLRVLLVEDDPDHAELVRRALGGRRASVDITVIEDGETALAYLRRRSASGNGERPPHLILLDLSLPRMDGFTLLREVKAVPELRGIPCVVLSTSDDESDMTRAYELHASSYLVKPGDDLCFSKLLADVERHWVDDTRQPAALGVAALQHG